MMPHGRETIVPIQFGVMEVTLPDRPEAALRLVVVKGFGQAPMMLLTNRKGTKSYKSLWKITRWGKGWRGGEREKPSDPMEARQGLLDLGFGTA